MESASIQNAKNYRRADMNRAIESIFAEYQKELLEEYDIFAIEATYESGNYREENILERLEYFGAGKGENEIQKIEFLTDHGAQNFYDQAIDVMEQKYGVDVLKEQLGMTEVWKKQDQLSEEYQKEEKQGWDNLGNLLEEEEVQLPKENNPMEQIQGLKKTPFLSLVVPADMAVSEKKIDENGCLSVREKNKGFGNFQAEQERGALSKLVFDEYLLEHFCSATDNQLSQKKGMLDYELEYLCAGKGSDRENLETVAKKLLGLRFGCDYAFLQSSTTKQAEARALALTLCSLATVPALEEATCQVLLLAWAYGEAVTDVRTLLKGCRVPLMKSENTWQLSLTSLMEMDGQGTMDDGKDIKEGMSYREYLRILLFLEKAETLSFRALDLIEKNMQNVYGLTFFQADFCVSKLQVKSKCKLRRNITYRFITDFQYQ